MLSKNSFQRVLILSKKEVKKNPNSTFGNGLGYTNKFQLIQNSAVHNFTEIGDDYFPEVFLELKGE